MQTLLQRKCQTILARQSGGGHACPGCSHQRDASCGVWAVGKADLVLGRGYEKLRPNIGEVLQYARELDLTHPTYDPVHPLDADTISSRQRPSTKNHITHHEGSKLDSPSTVTPLKDIESSYDEVTEGECSWASSSDESSTTSRGPVEIRKEKMIGNITLTITRWLRSRFARVLAGAQETATSSYEGRSAPSSGSVQNQKDQVQRKGKRKLSNTDSDGGENDDDDTVRPPYQGAGNTKGSIYTVNIDSPSSDFKVYEYETHTYEALTECQEYVLREIPLRLREILVPEFDRDFQIIEQSLQRRAIESTRTIVASLFEEFRKLHQHGSAPAIVSRPNESQDNAGPSSTQTQPFCLDPMEFSSIFSDQQDIEFNYTLDPDGNLSLFDDVQLQDIPQAPTGSKNSAQKKSDSGYESNNKERPDEQSMD
ncbi:hypothetical protein FHL15_003430 [Xylaria flabelliformis]|uniref:Uncharacterized protein n=1 Tax=Xylaria flabelliformis TaxID=2512241 RepID=A0A553I6P7_9PEZI|nr:hypothetical protein FHL15_003430 [Xylaria flabelliformis]